MLKKCSVSDCLNKHHAKNYCEKHYYLVRKNGVPVPRIIRNDDISRFWSYVSKTDNCWEWKGYSQKGYGCFRKGDKVLRAHRYAYELLVGKLTDGLVLDHLCNNKKCVNPQHLEEVTNPENTKRHYSRLRSS